MSAPRNIKGGVPEVRPFPHILQYCDMTPERRKCAVREEQQRRPLIDNG
jgi:hypothetical protein